MSASAGLLRARARPRATAAVTAAATLVVAAAVSVTLRTTAMGEGLWIDEGLAAGIAAHPLGELPGLLRQDGSPLLYYVLLHGWIQLFGDAEAALRSLSLVAALATIPAALWAGWSLFGPRAGVIAAGLAAVNPFLTAYAQEARMYALVGLLSLLACATFLHAFAVDREPQAARRRGFALAFGVALALLLHTHNWGLFLAAGSLAALAVLAAGAPDRRGLVVDAGLAYGLAALLYAPWVATLLFQVAHTGAPWSNVPGPGKLADALLVPLGGGLAGAAGLGLALLGSARRAPGEQARDRRPIALLAVAAVTAGLAWIVSTIEPHWADRYFAVLLGPLLLAVAAGAARLGPAGLIAAGILGAVWATDTGRAQHGNARDLAAALDPGRRTLVVSAQPEQLAVLRHYMGPAPRYATTLGLARDPTVMDWRDATRRLRVARPGPTAALTLAGTRAGDRVVLVRPVIADPRRWRAPWTRLVRARAAAWVAAFDASPRLTRVGPVRAGLTGGADVTAVEWRVRAP